MMSTEFKISKKKYLDIWPNTYFCKYLAIHKYKCLLQITEGKEQYKIQPNILYIYIYVLLSSFR